MTPTPKSTSKLTQPTRTTQLASQSANRPVRLQDIADKAQTSVATVSMALAGSKRISQQTRHRIAELSQKMGYQPRRSINADDDRSTSTLKKMRVGFLVFDRIDVPTNATLLQAMSSIASQNNIRIELSVLDPANKTTSLFQCATELASHNHGLILVGEASIQQLKQLQAANIPTVMFGYPLNAPDESDLPAPIVTTDWQAMGHRATRELFAMGHRNIAFVSGHIIPGMLHDRCLDGYLLAHHHAGRTPDKRCRFILPHCYNAQIANVAHMDTARKINTMKNPPTAFVFTNTGTAEGIHEKMLQLNPTFAPDHAIVAHINVSPQFPKKPITVCVDLHGMAQTAFNQLRSKFNAPQHINTVVHVPFTLRLPSHHQPT